MLLFLAAVPGGSGRGGTLALAALSASAPVVAASRAPESGRAWAPTAAEPQNTSLPSVRLARASACQRGVRRGRVNPTPLRRELRRGRPLQPRAADADWAVPSQPAAQAARQAAAAAFRCAHGATRTDAGTFVCTECYSYALG